MIFRGNRAIIGNKAGLAKEISAKGKVGNKTYVNSLVDEFMELCAIVDWSLVYFEHKNPICEVE